MVATRLAHWAKNTIRMFVQVVDSPHWPASTSACREAGMPAAVSDAIKESGLFTDREWSVLHTELTKPQCVHGYTLEVAMGVGGDSITCAYVAATFRYIGNCAKDFDSAVAYFKVFHAVSQLVCLQHLAVWRQLIGTVSATEMIEIITWAATYLSPSGYDLRAVFENELVEAHINTDDSDSDGILADMRDHCTFSC